MASCMMAPGHYLKQCGLIIKLINKVLQHSSQWIITKWIITKDLKIPISKMRLKLVWLDNFTPSHESFIYSAVIIVLFVMVVSWYLLSPSLILLASVYSRGTRYPPHVSFVTTPQGAMSQEHSCNMRSQSHDRSWPPLLKLKFGNGCLTSKCRNSSCKKISSGSQFQFQFQFHFQFHQFQFQFQFRNWNWNWPAIPIPELNWPQPWSCMVIYDSYHLYHTFLHIHILTCGYVSACTCSYRWLGTIISSNKWSQVDWNSTRNWSRWNFAID